MLERAEFRHAPILAAGANFGSGSSREHAPWALQDWGYRCVVAPSFADIFRSNCTNVGLLCVELPEADVRVLIDAAPAGGDGRPRGPHGDAAGRPRGRRSEIDDAARERLLNGWDAISLTENRDDEIAAYESERERRGPNTLALG